MLRRIGWFVVSRWRKRQGLVGKFVAAESSFRAGELSALWDHCWPDAQPVGHLLREQYRDRWVRFRNLPESWSTAERSVKDAETLRRHQVALQELLAETPSPYLRVIGTDWDWTENKSGWTKDHFPSAWPWRTFQETYEDDAEHYPVQYFWVNQYESVAELAHLLVCAAAHQAHFIISDAALTWIYHPSDGWADVILPTATLRREMAARHPGWVPDHLHGL